jgi:uncharacterized membrane protein YgdD (TMEM256/DUF423 family)
MTWKEEKISEMQRTSFIIVATVCCLLMLLYLGTAAATTTSKQQQVAVVKNIESSSSAAPNNKEIYMNILYICLKLILILSLFLLDIILYQDDEEKLVSNCGLIYMAGIALFSISLLLQLLVIGGLLASRYSRKYLLFAPVLLFIWSVYTLGYFTHSIIGTNLFIGIIFIYLAILIALKPDRERMQQQVTEKLKQKRKPAIRGFQKLSNYLTSIVVSTAVNIQFVYSDYYVVAIGRLPTVPSVVAIGVATKVFLIPLFAQ